MYVKYKHSNKKQLSIQIRDSKTKIRKQKNCKEKGLETLLFAFINWDFRDYSVTADGQKNIQLTISYKET